VQQQQSFVQQQNFVPARTAQEPQIAAKPTQSPNVTPFTFFQNTPFNSLFSDTASRGSNLTPVEPAFLSIPAVKPQPTSTTQSPRVFIQPSDPFTSFRSRGQFSSSLSRAPVSSQEVQESRGQFSSSLSRAPVRTPLVQESTPATPVVLQQQSFGRPAPTVTATEEDPHHLRMMTQRARVQIKNFLPKAENEGDAIEKLRAKIENFQNRNRARG